MRVTRMIQWAAATTMLSSIVGAQTPAFPEAEGAGKFSKGGRGGAVYEVTNLADSGAGSLREAVSGFGPRSVVFRVSGTIRLLSELNIRNPFITIAGQTAPGDGICIADRQVVVNADHVILRYLRFRLGDETGVDTDAIWGRSRKNIIIDHCSASWSVDESMSFYGNDSLTIQWCIISESLFKSNHPKGAHGYGGIWGGRNASFHHNLIAHHSSRTPRFSGGETQPCENVDFRNNVIYNWGFNSAYGGEGGTVNMVANYYKAGPATRSTVRYRIIQPSDSAGKWHVENNFVFGSAAITANNWAGGVQGSYSSQSRARALAPFPFVPIRQQTAEEAYALVLQAAGANLPRRDAVDERVLREVQTGTATFDGHTYEKDHGFADTTVMRGIIDSQRDVGGWPALLSQPPQPDSDHDGMPDPWEKAHGLNPDNPLDRNLLNDQGYTMLELFLNSLVTATLVPERQDQSPQGFDLDQNFPNPFNPATTLSFSLPRSGRVTVLVYNDAGGLVKTIADEIMPTGTHLKAWDGKNQRGQNAASGLYFCTVDFMTERRIIKMHLLR